MQELVALHGPKAVRLYLVQESGHGSWVTHYPKIGSSSNGLMLQALDVRRG